MGEQINLFIDGFSNIHGLATDDNGTAVALAHTININTNINGSVLAAAPGGGVITLTSLSDTPLSLAGFSAATGTSEYGR